MRSPPARRSCRRSATRTCSSWSAAAPPSAQACLAEALGICAKLPSGYQRDLQLLKPPLFRGIDLALADARHPAAGDRRRCVSGPRTIKLDPGDPRRRRSERAGRARRHSVPRGVSPHRREIPQIGPRRASRGHDGNLVRQSDDRDDAQGSQDGLLSPHLGIEFTEFGDDYLRGTMPVEPRTHQPMGYLHGGASRGAGRDTGQRGREFRRRSREIPLPRARRSMRTICGR